AAIWGLLRAAQAEHPGRVVLVDLDDSEASARTLPAVAGLDETQVAIRQGEPLVPRLVRSPVPERPAAPPYVPSGTVLVADASGGLGAAVARHLITEHRAERLLLPLPPGSAATEGGADLEKELRGLGAEASVVTCDPSDRTALAALLDDLPRDAPL